MSNGLVILLFASIGFCGDAPVCELPRNNPSVDWQSPGPMLAQLQPVQDPGEEGMSVSPAQRRIQIRRLLAAQVRVWRDTARELLPHLAQQTVDQTPDLALLVGGRDSSESQDLVAELELIVRSHTGEVVLQFIREMRVSADPWEQAYVGRAMVALLDRAYEDQLARQDRLLVQVFVSGPSVIRELPAPGIQFPATPDDLSAQTPSGASSDAEPVDVKDSESYLTELRRAQDDAEKRNATDELIMWRNRATEAFYRDFLAMVIRSKSPIIYKAVFDRLTRQLRTADGAFQQTVDALGRARLSELSLAQLRPMYGQLVSLSRHFRGMREYTVYTEVQKQVRTQSSFQQRQLDFSQSVADLLARLEQQIELASQREPLDRRQMAPGRTQTEQPELLERTPGPND